MNTGASNIYYASGEHAIILDDEGCGFCYYKSGRVAICVSKVNGYQKRYYAYSDNRKKTLLCSIDENVVGSAGRVNDGNRLVLTRDGGLISDEKDYLIKTWKWESHRQISGEPPQKPINIRLNESLDFTFVDRKAVTLEFSHHGVKIEFNCGEKLRRVDTYLDHSRRITTGPQRGKLVMKHDCPTLIQRQIQLGQQSIQDRSNQKPRSENINNESIRDVISKLENQFDNYDGHRVSPAVDGGWKEKARQQTVDEVPLVPPSGCEVGLKPKRFGQDDDFEKNILVAQRTAGRLKSKENRWLGSVEIRNQLEKENPNLSRSSALSCASGRYSRDIVAPTTNPMPQVKRLLRITASSFVDFLTEKCRADQLVLVACLREDSRECRHAENVLELVNEMIHSGEVGVNRDSKFHLDSYDPDRDNSFRMAKFEMSESSFISQKFNIRALPAFLMFFGGKLVTVTSFGGASVRLKPTTKNAHLVHIMDQPPRTLLVEPEFKKQIVFEKLLKKESFKWDLALDGKQATEHVKRFEKLSYGLIIISDRVSVDDFRLLERVVCRQGKSDESCLTCIIVNSSDFHYAKHMCLRCRRATGKRVSAETELAKENQICPHCGIIIDAEKHLKQATDVVVYRNLKAATLHRLAELWNEKMKPNADTQSHKGLTKTSLITGLNSALQSARRGRLPQNSAVSDMVLSVNETSYRGVRLNRSRILS